MLVQTEWRFDKPPDEEEVIVSIHDDSGDTPFDYTSSGWYFNGNWIVDNQICYHVVAWAPLPLPVKVAKYGHDGYSSQSVWADYEKIRKFGIKE